MVAYLGLGLLSSAWTELVMVVVKNERGVDRHVVVGNSLKSGDVAFWRVGKEHLSQEPLVILGGGMFNPIDVCIYI